MLSHTGCLAVIQGNQRTHNRLSPGMIIGLSMMANPEWWAVSITKGSHVGSRTGSPGNNIRTFEVLVGTGLPEGSDGYKNDSWIEFLQLPVAQLKSIEIARLKGLNDKIGGGNQLLENSLPGGGIRIQCDAPFIDIQGKPEETLFRVRLVMPEWANITRWVTAGPFNLYDIGTEVTHYFTAHQPLFFGQVQNSVRAEHAFLFLLCHAHACIFILRLILLIQSR